MEKIGLISYQFAYNYGTCLQAYALWKAIENNNYQSEYIDFNWKFPYQELSSSKRAIRNIKKYVGSIKHWRLLSTIAFDKYLHKNKKEFDLFKNKYIIESKKISQTELADLENKYSKFIIGSDQTWNPDCVNEKYFLTFLLSFVSNSNKKFSYAPSIGRTILNEHTKNLYNKYLCDFSEISCRETSGCNILNNLLKRKITKVLDPTLLLTAAEWNKICSPNIQTQKYVFCYILGNKKCICEYAKFIAEKRNLKLIILPNHVDIYKSYKKYVIPNIGPCEFLSLIKNCDFLVTDSFHGTIFAINFNKEFYSFLKRNGNTDQSDNNRIKDVLDLFEISDRLKKDSDTQENKEKIDYIKVNKILSTEREKSHSYLSYILNK